MGFITDFIVNFRKNLTSNLAQIGLVYLLLPVCALVIGGLFGGGNGTAAQNGFVQTAIAKIPLCELWADMIFQYNGALTVSEVASSTVLVILRALPEALIVSLCVHVCSRVADLIGIKGMHILSSFLGVFLATIIVNLTDKSKNVLTEILIECGVIIVMIIGLKILIRSRFHGAGVFSFKRILFLIADGVYAVITTGYISGLLLAAGGYYSSLAEAARRIMILSSVMIISAAIAWVLKGAEQNDNPI